MEQKAIKALLFAGGVLLSAAVSADGPSAAMLAGACAACHGPAGSSVGVTPSIAGAKSEYFVETMKAFQSGARKATVMDRIAKGYTEAELKAMGDYFAAQPVVAQKQAFDPKKAEMGKTLHEQNCEKCHESGGMKADEGGILAGQSTLYLHYSMDDFHNGLRETPKKMKTKVEAVKQAHGDAGLEALIHYYASQK